MRLLNENLLELKKTLKEVLEKISMLDDEVDNFAKRTDIITLQRYVEFWEPIDFVTRNEVNNFLRRKFKEEGIVYTKKTTTNHVKVEEPKKENTNQHSIEEAYPDND